jgi:hypothetical protein
MRRKPLSLFDKTTATVFQGVHTWDALSENLRTLHLDKNELIQVVAVGSNGSLPELLLSNFAPSGLTHLGTNGNLSLFEYHRRFGRQDEKRITVQFAVARPMPEPIYILLFVAQPQCWRNGILPLTESLYPRAARPFLTQSELHEVMKNLQRLTQPRGLRILEFSSKMRLTATARKRFQSVREWTDADLDSVFRDARERNVWFRSVSFDIVADRDGYVVSTGIQAKLSKYGYFSCTGGFELFEKSVLRRLIQIGAERLKFFSNRDRLGTAHHALKPLRIEYEMDVFKSAEQSRRLVEAMQRLKHGTCTILHANPYIHLSIVDNIDFSSADLWVLSQRQIILIPQLKASEVALKRIVNHIFEHFREGTISELQEQHG